MAFGIVVVGASLGGFRALRELLGGLPPDFALPLAVVQHRAAEVSSLAAMLQRSCPLRVSEPDDKQALQPGCVYLAPPGYHLLVEPGSLALSTGEAVLYARPSIDALFESAADAYPGRAIGVVLTGSSTDGVEGLRRIRRGGGLAIAQDPATAESPVLPAAAIAAGAVDHVVPLAEIAPLLGRLSGPSASG